ncbi:acetyl-CoA carboxylase biotin carboxylase subunit [Sulfolobus sp. B1]|uniref:acetyl-CoA carboxylase biotin carboxylase subunit n=1 Tax=Sulfolobus sp. B1 TaxID=2200888 RepID=UPI00117C328B|nr:biotin carboxylase N-terminal domain-containing protein [Sulfolobus sp. B1]TRM96760.1 acetyl-CoA carboxylase biotin carboxylase subunit [Sulfolobus sp. B1]
MPPFNKVLVANRGEIAIRVMKAVKEMGMKAVAVYSDADKYAPHVKYADEAYWIGPSPAIESYLNIDRIVDAALKAHADAVHPGYGFLSENPRFVREVEKVGLTFIGPSAEVMDKIKDKLDGKRIARKAGVPTSPGPLTPVESVDEALKVAEEIGYPIMLKAAGGGAGVGIIKVDNSAELAEAFERSKRLSYSAFGRAEIYIEKAAVKPKHIETQLIGDKYGNYVVAFERECTIQRRNQKLIEEAPSPSITWEERKTIIEASIRFGKEINYFTLGTMEFVYSPVTHDFYFLEINKRVQVEHTVTEFITGIDLVKLQIRLAAGEYLPFSQEDLKIRGHAIQFRINAEDPLNEFTPQSGYITYYKEPTGPGVRVDSGIEVGTWVPPYYDPLVSKLIVYGQSRDYAIQVGLRALNDYKIGGVKTTIPLYKLILQDPDFWEGNFTTAYISEKIQYFKQKLTEEEERKVAIAIALYNRGLLKRKAEEKKIIRDERAPNKWKTYGIALQSNTRVMW